jgi:hypothetical protein
MILRFRSSEMVKKMIICSQFVSQAKLFAPGACVLIHSVAISLVLSSDLSTIVSDQFQ